MTFIDIKGRITNEYLDAAKWSVGEYGEHLGYDCMTGGIRVGPVILDGADYGQKRCTPIEPEALERMKADARLIAAAPAMLIALRAILFQTAQGSVLDRDACITQARAVVAKAEAATPS